MQPEQRGAPAQGSVRTPRLDVVAVFVLAVVVRLLFVVTSSGGVRGNYGYDASVYFTSADALLHGRAPYGDYVLLHPPGLTLVLTPFALLGRLTTDHLGFVAANLAFSALGAVNAALVTVIARRWGTGRLASLLGGGFYAVWLSAAGPELSARLEPLGTFAFLLAVLLLAGPRPSGRAVVGAGVALGAALTVKVWWIVPIVVLIAWYAVVRREGRTTMRLLAGAVAIVVVVCGPFFVLARGSMYRMIVSDQFGRPAVGTSPFRRVVELSSLDQFHPGDAVKIVLTVVIAVVVAVLVVVAWRQPPARPVITVLAVQVIVLLVSPTYFDYYSGYVAAGFALLVAASATPRPGSERRRPTTTAVVPASVGVVAAVVTIAALVTGPASVLTNQPLRVAALRPAASGVRCVVSDSPMTLISLDVLSRDLARGCPNWVDVSGRAYELPHAPAGLRARKRDKRWQALVLRYLTSGQAVVLIRPSTGLSAATRDSIHRLPVLARTKKLFLHRTGG